MVLLIVLTVVTVWLLAALGLALLTGGVIHGRDEHDRPFGGGRFSERAVRRHAMN